MRAAPIRHGLDGSVHAGRLRARYVATGDGFVIRLSTTKFSPSIGRFSIARHFTLRSTAVFDRAGFTSNMHALLTHPEQTSVSLRTVAPVTGTTAEAILPLQGYAHRKFGRENIWLRDGQGRTYRNGSDGADDVWGVLELQVCTDRLSIADHLVGAGQIYQEIADPLSDVAHYSTENE